MTVAMRDLRRERNIRLRETDWIDLPGAAAVQTARRVAQMQAQRQALRDLPATVQDPVAFEDWPVADFLSETLPLGLVRAWAERCVTEQTARIEAIYFTATPLRSLVYGQKLTEAARYVATGGTGDYPLLAADVGSSSGADLAAVAATVIARAGVGTSKAAGLEHARRIALDALAAATDRAGIVAALDAFDAAVVTAELVEVAP